MLNHLGRKTAFGTAIAFCAYLLLFFFIDRPIDLWVHQHYQHTWLSQSGKAISYLANGSFVSLGVACGLILTLVADAELKLKSTRLLLYVCVSAAIAMVVGDGLKYLLGRYRPVMLFDHDLYGLHFLSAKWELNSTPSGHTLRAFSILTALSLLYRRCSILFIAAAFIIGASRVAVTAHYPSDVLFGAFIGIVTALWTFRHFPFGEGDVENMKDYI